MTWKNRIASCAAILLLIGIVIAFVDLCCFCESFYEKEYGKLKTADEIGISEQDLWAASEALLDYLRDERDDLLISAKIHGEWREVFNEREKLHMADVKQLYRMSRASGYTCLALGALTLGLLLFRTKKSHRAGILKGYLNGNLIFLAIIAALGIFAAVDFDTFWTGFHRILFTNDLWLLNPQTDILIMMFPEQFFFDLVMRIAGAAALTMGILMLGAYLWKRKLDGQAEDETGKNAGKTGYAA